MRKSLGMTAVLVALVVGPALRAEDPTQELLDKAIKAHGGSGVLNKYKASTVKMKGKLTVAGRTLDYTGVFSSQLPDRMRQEITVEVMGQQFPVITVMNKDKGWNKEDGKTKEMTKEMLEEARQEMHGSEVGQLTPLKDKEYKLSALAEVKVGDRPAVGLRAARKHYRDVNLYFDKKTHLLVKMETRAKDLMGGGKEITVETFFDDYKPIKGMQMPHRLAMKRDGKDFLTGEVTDVKLAERLGDDVFAKP